MLFKDFPLLEKEKEMLRDAYYGKEQNRNRAFQIY